MISCPECKNYFEVEGTPDPDEVVFCPHCNAVIMFYEAVELAAGSEIGGFRLLEQIGQGGMGLVFLAEQVSMSRKVALKILAEELVQDKTAVEQFMNEVKTTARLEHPAIVRAIDAGEEHGVFYFAMSYVDGSDLETYLETKGRLPEDRALRYILRIAEALKYAWDTHRLLHRDIKPGNIIVSQEDEAFLLDMGIAQHFSESFERQELIDGSPYYMSPEQTFAEPLSWSSDLYSLGATLYHLVVGVPPYDRDDEDVDKIVQMHSVEPFPDPAVRNPHVKITPAVTMLLERMMAKNSQDRFASWEKFLDTGRKLLEKIEAGSVPAQLEEVVPPQEKAEHYEKKYNRLVTVTTFVAITVAVLMSIFFIFKGIAERRASRTLMTAEQYITQEYYDPEEALGLYADAVAASSSLLVGNELMTRAKQGYEKAEDVLELEYKRRSHFKVEIDNIVKLYSEANRCAPKVALQKCEKARKKLQSLKPALESEFRKYQQLGRKIHLLQRINQNKLKNRSN